MFDVGFSELLLIAIVALVVLGPERLPRVARTAGHLLGRFQRYANQVKSDINREMHLEDLRKMEAQLKASAESFEASVRSETSAVQAQVDDAVQMASTPAEAAAPVVEAAREVELSAHDLAQAAHAADDAARAELAAIAQELSNPTAPPAPQAAAEPPSPQLSLALEPPEAAPSTSRPNV